MAERARSEPPAPAAGGLPFTVGVAKEDFRSPPRYMGQIGGMDFPFCAVKIEEEYWILLGNAGGGPSRWKGTNFLNATTQPGGRNENSRHVSRPYMLGGMWYDPAGKKLYAPMHCETRKGQVAGHGPNPIDRQIHLSSSTDKGATWTYEGPLMTRTGSDDPWRGVYDFSGVHWNGGDGDFYLFVDERGGYIYLYTNHYTWPKRGTPPTPSFLRHNVARCAIADKMAPGKWRKFYNGKWEEPGVGGKSSYVNGYCVMYNTYLKKYISFNYGSGISVCGDMDKQDWSPSYEILPKEQWGTGWSTRTPMGFGWGGWHVMNADKTDIYTGGQTLYFYKYWMGHKPECFRLDLDLAPAKENHGYHALGGYAYTPTVYSGPLILYGDAPFYDSPDPIESRRTRRVGHGSPEVTASAGWDRQWASSTAGSSLEMSFRGAEVYWRAARGPGMGKADVFIDGTLAATVDTWASVPTNDMFAFIRTGLDAKADHTLKIVVRGEKNARSTGTAIAHLCFEYSADSHRALHGFSSVQGKNHWRYRERTGDAVADMTFRDGAWVGPGGSGIAFGSMLPAASAAIRLWTAPRDGAVRIEGTAGTKPGDVVAIEHNATTVWPQPAAAAGAPAEPRSHDLKLAVRKGDTLGFVAHRPGAMAVTAPARPAPLAWDPAITYVEP